MMNPTAEKYRLLVEGAQDHAIFMTDPQGTILTWNSGVERILGYSEEEWVGQNAHIIFTPEDLANRECERERETAAANGRAEDIRWHVRRNGTRFWADGVMSPLYDDVGTLVGFGKVMRDATDRKRAQTSLLDAEERLRLAAEATGVGTFDFDPVSGELRWDERCKALFGLPPDAPVDYSVFLLGVHPEDRDRTDTVVQRALDPSSGVDGEYSVEFRTVGITDGVERWIAAKGRVFFDREGTRAERFVGTVLDISERRLAVEALTRSEARFRIQADAMPQMMWATDPFGNHLYYNRRWYEYTGQTVEESLGYGFALALHPEDTERTLEKWQRAWRGGDNYEIEYRFRRHDGVYRWFVGRAEPVRDPETGEVTMWVGTCTDIEERKAFEMEREQLLQEQRRLLLVELARTEREAQINQIGVAVRAALEPDEVLRVTVETLGKALGADRCYFVTYDLDRDWGKIETDWHRKGLVSLVGEFRLSNLALNREAAFQSGQTQVVYDVHEQRHTLDSPLSDDAPAASTPLPPGFTGTADPGISLMDTLGLRAVIRAPLVSSKGMTALTVAMADGARHWTEEEVRLVETVAAQTRAAVEAARLQQRERNIAQQLQAALQPPPPPSLPGLALKDYYKPALQEAGVGGDFFDVFPVEKGCTALVVGDLSGKGLAAASEVATVRNMVRYAAYSGRTVAEAITDLNRIIVEHNLLTGFATLFVGLYDQNERTLTYVNCGQEPGLVWRAATGMVENLIPTGPVLGGFESADGYSEETTVLAPGDVLALFTDGMTEVGPNRTELLEIEGLTALFAQCCAEVTSVIEFGASDAASLVRDNLIAGVEAHAGGASGRGDDIALLVGVASV